ncbi:hypothetical protein JWG42_16015 [Desulfoprunum benzoelyticum]|uniref:Putative membrane protein n=1 Tax=Desulfoprunum benzoelyticum TaxID=1506996 RepID=A0A840URU3_9BACT|nr:DUF2231 domain-containing protein [Desulfoprunum benzoelyticum]MBB5347546.1 putative membrane protein [Desulfoprunum benzoelyticum]MBM9531664.1 hypothetical protein [Desulfoprunum benzoelyticum]
MVEDLFALLENIGFSHPLHPMMTHLPMGMVVGMVVFSLIGLVGKKPRLSETAYYCSLLALVSVFPAIAAGLLDWLHSLGGIWSPLIIVKMILATLLILLLIGAAVLKQWGASPGKLLLVYLLCLACAGGLGYAGGELVYGG